MIYGIGTDICDIRRIRDSINRYGDRFASKILCDAELAVWKTRSERWPERGARYLATRFSAKESFSKAIGLGMHTPMSWRGCESANLPSGQPTRVLHGPLKTWFEAKRWSAHISVTDETDYAASFCVVETIEDDRHWQTHRLFSKSSQDIADHKSFTISSLPHNFKKHSTLCNTRAG